MEVNGADGGGQRGGGLTAQEKVWFWWFGRIVSCVLIS